MPTPDPAHLPLASSDPVIQEVSRHLKGLRFGSIEIQVHDGQVVAIERRERTRLAPVPDEGSE